MSRTVAVVGGGLGGMAAAGELARTGYDVTLFEAGRLGGKAGSLSVGGVTLDTGPTLLTMPDVVRSAFARLDATSLLPRIIEVDPQCEYSFASGARFTAHRDVERTASAVSGLGASEASGLFAFYEEAAAMYRFAGEPYLDAPFDGLGAFLKRTVRAGPRAIARGLTMGTLHDLAARHFRSEELRQFVGRFATYAGASPYEASAAFALIPHVERAFGTHHVQGGIAGLAQALATGIRRLGVRVEEGVKASVAHVNGRHRVGPRGDAREFDAVVVNADPLESLGRAEEPLSLSGYVLLLEVERRLSLPHHSVLFGADDRSEFAALFDGELPTDPTVYVNHPAASDDTMAPPGRSGLYLMVNAPALPRAGPRPDWTVLAGRLRDHALTRLSQRCPEVAGGTLRVLSERTPEDFERLGAPGGSLYGFLPHGRFGPFRRPRLRGRQPGLFYAGGGTHPGGGVPLVLLSGHFAAGMATQWLRGEP